MFGSTRCLNQCAALLLIMIQLRLQRNTTSLEAFSISARRSPKHVVGRNSLLRTNYYKIRSLWRHFASSSSSDAVPHADLSRSIRERYGVNETDGVLELAVSRSIMFDSTLDFERTLIPAIMDASGGTKGVAASIMNSLIGSCLRTSSVDEQNLSLGSSRILFLMEALQKTYDVVPDIVTYSLAYRALSIHHQNGPNLEVAMLEEAERRSKKIGGGKRRKLLASVRRKKCVSFLEAENDLKGILGSDFKVLLEADDFAVVNKPSGIPCFHKKTTTAGKIKRGKKNNQKRKPKDKATSFESSDISLESALVSCGVQLSTINPEALGLVHRLDRGSSGCIVLAKSNAMHARLISEFFLRRTTKKYIALVRESLTSSIPDAGSGFIDSPVNGRPAKSRYNVIERYRFSDDKRAGNAALLEFEIFTGRKHQIRVHAAEVLGSPVWGDPLYGNEYDMDEDTKIGNGGSRRIFLHSNQLTIPWLRIEAESPVPMWWQSTLSELRRKR